MRSACGGMPRTGIMDLTAAQITALKDDTDRGYTFQEQLDNVGLIHLNGRVYDPGIGRFISADPTIPDPYYSQSFNRYSYVYNNPLNATDSSGFDPCPSDKTSCPTKSNGGNTPQTGSHIVGVDTGCEGCSEGSFAGGNFVNGVGQAGGSGQGGGGGSIAASNANAGAQNVAGNTEGAIQTGSDGSATILLGSISVPGQYSEWNQFSTWQTLLNNSSMTFNSPGYLPVTAAEWKDVLTGNRADFWSSRLAHGDPYGPIGCAFWCNSNIQASLGSYWQILGDTGMGLLDAGLLNAGDNINSETVDAIGNGIMFQYASFINGNGGDLPSSLQFYDIHQDVFNQYGIPMSFFGGTPGFGQPWELQFTTPIWCPNCNANTSPGGGGG